MSRSKYVGFAQVTNETVSYQGFMYPLSAQASIMALMHSLAG